MVSILLGELSKRLPEGNVWLGSTKLEHPEAWGQVLGGWNDSLMKRSGRGELHVCRLWVLHAEAQLSSLSSIMQQQRERNLIVRYTVNNDDRLPDLSLIWVAPSSGTQVDLGRLAGDPVGVLEKVGYRSLHGLKFDIGSALIVNTVSILPRRTETRDNHRKLTEWWSRAVTFPEASAG